MEVETFGKLVIFIRGELLFLAATPSTPSLRRKEGLSDESK
jgi:hypothetical protein